MTIKGTQIRMTRGDSETLTVTLEDDSFVEGDTVYMTVRPDVEEAISFQKVVTVFLDGAAVFGIEHDDTEGLDFGEYVYDVQLIRADGTVKTLVKPSKFILEEEVTY